MNSSIHMMKLVIEETADEAVKLDGAAHVRAHRLFAVLNEDGGLRVLEDDVVARVAAGELAIDLRV